MALKKMIRQLKAKIAKRDAGKRPAKKRHILARMSPTQQKARNRLGAAPGGMASQKRAIHRKHMRR